MIPIHTILHPTDFSEHAELSFQLACSLARDQGARVIVLHVAEQPRVSYSPADASQHPAPDHRKDLEEKLRGFQPPDAKVGVEYRLEQGIPATEILRVAEEIKCDLIVMGTQGKMGLGQTVLPGRWVGSVAGAVLRSATCPVLTVKMPDADAQP
jgi:nucleotide-binding universal stress UspA family protein